MSTQVNVPMAILSETQQILRQCGQGRNECQVLWLGKWNDPGSVDRIVHPVHFARGDGFELDSAWLNRFWLTLAEDNLGVRVQVHTHPGRAFHSPTDDAWPIIRTAGFLSLVIPRFASANHLLSDAFLTEIGPDGSWREVALSDRVAVSRQGKDCE